jgi:hypothetical protein
MYARPMRKRLAPCALVLFVMVAPGAHAQAPGYQAKAGEQFSGSGRAPDPMSPDCQVSNVVIQWGDATVSPATATSFEEISTDVGGTPIPEKVMTVSGTHAFRDLGVAYVAEVKVSYALDCVDSDKKPYHVDKANRPIFSVQVASGSGTGGTKSCPSPFAGIAVAASGPQALAAQATCVEPKKRYTDAQKKLLKAGILAAGAGVANDALFAYFASVSPIPQFKVFTPIFVIRGVAFGWAGVVLGLEYNDPPDPNYRSIASPPRVKLTRVAGRGKNVKAINAYLDALTDTAPLGFALMTSVNRAQGATLAKSKEFERKQMLAAAGYASRLADALDRSLALRSPARAAIGDLDVEISESNAAEAQEVFKASGLPPAILQPLTKAFGSTIAGYANDFIVGQITRPSARDLAASLAKGFDERKLFTRTAGLWRQFAKQVRRDPLAEQ